MHCKDAWSSAICAEGTHCKSRDIWHRGPPASPCRCCCLPQDLRSLMPLLPPGELAIAGHAMALSQWHQVSGRPASQPAGRPASQPAGQLQQRRPGLATCQGDRRWASCCTAPRPPAHLNHPSNSSISLAACRPTSSAAAAARPPPPSTAARGGSAPRPPPTASTRALTPLSSCWWSRQMAAVRCWGAARRCGQACSPACLASQTRSVWRRGAIVAAAWRKGWRVVLVVKSHLKLPACAPEPPPALPYTSPACRVRASRRRCGVRSGRSLGWRWGQSTLWAPSPGLWVSWAAFLVTALSPDCST